jgi:hypothetical protein
MEARSLLAQDVILSSAKCLPGYPFGPARCGIRQIVLDQGTSSFQV